MGQGSVGVKTGRYFGRNGGVVFGRLKNRDIEGPHRLAVAHRHKDPHRLSAGHKSAQLARPVNAAADSHPTHSQPLASPYF
jgi:hypothetical protein